MKLKLVLASFFMTLATFGQTTFRVSGQVQDETGQAIVGATVLLVKAKNEAILKSTFSDAEGRFALVLAKADSCKLLVSYVGFGKYTSDILVVNTTIAELTTITLKTATNVLEEVKVTAKKPFVERKIDRTVINPDALISNAGVSSLEVLEKSPGILVDGNGGISLAGKSGVVVFIDDKPTYMAANELSNYLRSLPSSTIESIEIMTNPPAKYDAAGNAGIINIRLKRNTVRGFNGNLNLAYGQGFYRRTNNSLNFNYRINKFNFFSNVAVNQNNTYQDLTLWRRYFDNKNALSSTFTQQTYIKRQHGGNNLKAGVDYYLDKKTTLGLVLTAFNNPRTTTTTNDAQIANASGQVLTLVQASNPLNVRWKSGSANANITHKMNDKGREISANVDIIKYQSDLTQTLDNSNLKPDKSLINRSVLQSSLPTNIDIQSAKIDYSTPLQTGAKFEAGAKTSLVNTGNIADFFDVIDNRLQPNYEFSNNFDYRENINAAYLNYAKGSKKLTVQAGLRFESTHIKGHQLGNKVVKDSSFTRQYNNLFPTFYVQYKLDSADRHQFGLSLGRRIDRPNYQDMNPFSYPMDRYTYYGGNPFLQPTFSYNASLSHTFKNYLTTTFEYSRADNVISETNEQRGTIYYSRPGNFAQQIAYGVSVTGTFTPAKWWTLQLYTTVVNASFKGPIYTQIMNEQRSYWVAAPTNLFQINKQWSAELAGTYQSRILSGQFLLISMGTVRAGIAKKIWKDQGTIKLNVSDLLYSQQVGGDIRNIANASASWYSYFDSRVATMSVSYRFSKGQNLRVRQSGGADNEQKRVKT